jgi:hypothetical protein
MAALVFLVMFDAFGCGSGYPRFSQDIAMDKQHWPFASFFGSSMTGDQVTALVTAMDFVFSFVFLVCVVILSRHTESVIESSQRKIVSAADYTVFVRNLPRGTL